MDHQRRAGLLFDFAVDFGAQFQVGGIHVSDDPRTDRTKCVVAFRPCPLAVGLLLIAGGYVVGDGVAEDVVGGLGGWDVLARPADHYRELTLEVNR
ncbi:hypothetical protein MGAST_04050 [Mycobacterium gastri 'Wayne']|nr:hypothetical protein MGAST_04050 [Mycobacterium gastri 'Wayne']